MAKLNVDEIEANGTNSNVKVVHKGTDGSCEIKAATNDAILQLNCSDNSHGVKLKAPANSAGQNYTMILPDNQIAANKFLKVKSVTGSGANAVGQLEYGDAPAQDLSSLNASNLTSGTLAAARFPSSGMAAKGLSLQLVQKQAVGNTDVLSIVFSNLENDTMYKMIAKHICIKGVSNSDTDTQIYMGWLDSSNNRQGHIQYETYRYVSSSSHDYGESYTGNNDYINIGPNRGNGKTQSFIADIYNYPANNWMTFVGFDPSYNSSSGNPSPNKSEMYASFNPQYSSDAANYRIHGIEIFSPQSDKKFTSGTEILLYKYIEV